MRREAGHYGQLMGRVRRGGRRGAVPRTVLQGGSQAPRVSGATWGTLGHGTVVEAGEGDASGGGEGVPRVKTAKNSGLGLETQHAAVALCKRGRSNMRIRGPALTSCLGRFAKVTGASDTTRPVPRPRKYGDPGPPRAKTHGCQHAGPRPGRQGGRSRQNESQPGPALALPLLKPDSGGEREPQAQPPGPRAPGRGSPPRPHLRSVQRCDCPRQRAPLLHIPAPGLTGRKRC